MSSSGKYKGVLDGLVGWAALLAPWATVLAAGLLLREPAALIVGGGMLALMTVGLVANLPHLQRSELSSADQHPTLRGPTQIRWRQFAAWLAVASASVAGAAALAPGSWVYVALLVAAVISSAALSRKPAFELQVSEHEVFVARRGVPLLCMAWSDIRRVQILQGTLATLPRVRISTESSWVDLPFDSATASVRDAIVNVAAARGVLHDGVW